MKTSFKTTLIFTFILFMVTFPLISSDSNPIPIKEEKIKSGDVTLFMRIVGNPDSSPIMIAINGGPGQSSHYMKTLEQLAGPNLTVVTFDQRGTGRSSESKEGYALQKYVFDIDAIRQHLKAKNIILFGHSFGGILAQRYASIYPGRVKSMILMGSGPPMVQAILAAQMKLGARIQKLVREGIITGPQPTEPARLLEYMLPAYFSNPKFPIPIELKESSFHMAVGQKTYSDSGAWDFREELKAVSCPVLFLWGEDDPFGKDMADVTQKALSNAKLIPITIKKCGHYWQENLEDFFTHIKNFLE